jgi:hypothetical protein
MEVDTSRNLMRHALATLAYRGGKALRGAPESFASFAGGTRTPLLIVAHLGDLIEWAHALAAGGATWHNSTPVSWDHECDRFFRALSDFDNFLASGSPVAAPIERLFQGPVADALTHVGQIAMLRRMAGAPTRGENYFVADIAAGRVGPDQAPPKREFE